MATGVVGTASMLRARRRDVNVKPNRRLDRKSSRGMLYENEELRLRTININAEVERGQNDIKKLRRENEQLRREIWGLRDEYDRLEGLLGQLHASGCSSAGNLEDLRNGKNWKVEDDENGRTVEENEQNLQKISSSIKMQGHKNSVKVNFDDLSVVDEESDDFIFGSLDSCERDIKNLAHEEGHLVNIFPVVEQLTNYFPPGLDSPEYLCPPSSTKSVYLASSGRQNIPNNTADHFSRDMCAGCPLPRRNCRERAIRYRAEEDKEHSREQNYDSEHDFVHTDSIHDAISSPQRGPPFHTLYQNNFPLKVPPLSKVQTLPEAFQGHESLDIFTIDTCSSERCESHFPVGGNLDQLLNDVHGRKDVELASQMSNTLESNELQKPTNPNGPSPETGISPGSAKHQACLGTDGCSTNGSHNDQTTESLPVIIETARAEIEELQKDVHDTPKGSDAVSVTAQLADLAVDAKAEDSSNRFQSNLLIQLEQTEDNGAAPTTHPTPTRKVGNVQHFIFHEHNPVFPEYLPNDTTWRRRLDKHQLIHRYESFISSTPELSEGKFDLFSGSVKNVHSFLPINDLVHGDSPIRKQFSPSSDVLHKNMCEHNDIMLTTVAQGDLTTESSGKGEKKLTKSDNIKNISQTDTTSLDVDIHGNAKQINKCENINNALTCKRAKPSTIASVEHDYSSSRELSVSRTKICNSQETKQKFFHDDDLFTVNLPPVSESALWQNSVKTGPEIGQPALGSSEKKDSFFGVSKTQYSQPCNENEYRLHCKGTKSKQFTNVVKSKYSDYRSPHKLSVIVGDTQQGRSVPSPGLDSPTKVDRNRRVSVYSNSKRKFGFGSKKDTRTRKQNMLTRSVSLDPERCCFVSPDNDCMIAINELGVRERAPSVSSKTSSLGTGLNSVYVTHAPSRNSNPGVGEKSVPWCGCWGNGCI